MGHEILGTQKSGLMHIFDVSRNGFFIKRTVTRCQIYKIWHMDDHNPDALFFASSPEFPGVLFPDLQLPPLPGIPGENLHGAAAKARRPVDRFIDFPAYGYVDTQEHEGFLEAFQNE